MGCNKCGIQTVAVQSTCVRWIAVYDLLEATGSEVHLVNARDTDNAFRCDGVLTLLAGGWRKLTFCRVSLHAGGSFPSTVRSHLSQRLIAAQALACSVWPTYTPRLVLALLSRFSVDLFLSQKDSKLMKSIVRAISLRRWVTAHSIRCWSVSRNAFG